MFGLNIECNCHTSSILRNGESGYRLRDLDNFVVIIIAVRLDIFS